MRRRFLLVPLALVALLGACGTDDDADDVTIDDPAGDPDTDLDEGADEGLDDAVDPDAFDPAQAEEDARALLGLAEDELTEDPMTRVVRRGDEDLPGTMDLRPGRRNVELDDDGSGTYVVTRVVVEVPDGDSLVVE